MTQQIINVGSAPNDGLGDPIRTAYIKCNNNFGELYSRAQTEPPTTLVGSIGDQAGMYAYDSNYFYYCYADYDGSSIIWAQISEIGNVSVSQIASGTSNVKIADINGNATVSINGTSNVVVFSTTGMTATANITGANINGTNIYGTISTAAQPSITSLGILTSLDVNGNITGGNLLTGGLISATGNITGGNLTTAGRGTFGSTVSATGNVTGGNLISNNNIVASANIISLNQISATGNITTTGYFVGTFVGNVTGNFVVPGANTQVLFNTSGNADANSRFTFDKSTSLLTVTGNIDTGNISATAAITATGNITGGNLITAGLGSFGSTVSAAGNITGGNLRTAGQVSAAGNITGGNLSTGIISGTSISVTGNITGGNVLSAGVVSSTGNITGGNVIGGGLVAVSNITGGNLALSGIISATGNITGGNITTAGTFTTASISASGNITAGNLLTSGTTINTGVSTTGNVSATGNITGGNLSIGGAALVTANITGGNLSIGGTTIVSGNITGGNIITGGVASITGNITGGNLTTGIILGTSVSVSGNITGGNLLTSGLLSATGNITGANASLTGNTVVTGNITVNSQNQATAIVNGALDGVGNIGSASKTFNTVHAKATTAQYADLAECYLADENYAPGTVLAFGGTAELTISSVDQDQTIAGVVSTNPAYRMNSGLKGNHVVALALTGRVPCCVQGPVNRGDMMVSAGNGRARSEKNPVIGSVIGKALESFDGEIGTIEVVVGRL